MSSRHYIVINACVAGAWTFKETYTTQALSILDAIESYRVYPVVPDRFYIEALRICQKKTMKDNSRPVSDLDAWQRFELITALPILSVPLDSSFYMNAWNIACAANLTVHDALYVALAQEWHASLWTLDAGLAGTPTTVYSDVFDLQTVMFPY